jgi:hypothetical protein
MTKLPSETAITKFEVRLIREWLPASDTTLHLERPQQSKDVHIASDRANSRG